MCKALERHLFGCKKIFLKGKEKMSMKYEKENKLILTDIRANNKSCFLKKHTKTNESNTYSYKKCCNEKENSS